MENSMSELEVKLRNWFKYSVLFTCVPFLFAVVLWKIIGHPKDWLELFPDLILTVFSIGVNSVSYISDLEASKKVTNRASYVKDACEVSLFFFAVLYFGVFNFDFTKNQIFDNEENANKAMRIVYVITWVVGIAYALSIAAIEIINNKKDKKEEEEKEEKEEEEEKKGDKSE